MLFVLQMLSRNVLYRSVQFLTVHSIVLMPNFKRNKVFESYFFNGVPVVWEPQNGGLPAVAVIVLAVTHPDRLPNADKTIPTYPEGIRPCTQGIYVFCSDAENNSTPC